jgi:hypothetical protein
MNLEHRLLSWYYSIPPSKRLIVDQLIAWGFGFLTVIMIIATLAIVNQ